ATNTASGTLTLAGGNTFIYSNLVVGNAGFSTGKVFLAGGKLNLTNESGSATITIPSGSLTLNKGALIADNLLLTNSAGQFIFNGGTLLSKGTTVSNTMPFVVGDGTNAATFQLLGGTHYFANGLTISSNAVLSGCGTIIGPIINHGTIATNCGVVTGPPSIAQPPACLIVTQGHIAS